MIHTIAEHNAHPEQLRQLSYSSDSTIKQDDYQQACGHRDECAGLYQQAQLQRPEHRNREMKGALEQRVVQRRPEERSIVAESDAARGDRSGALKESCQMNRNDSRRPHVCGP